MTADSASVRLAGFLALVAAAAASGYLSAHWTTQGLREELALRPPVVIADLTGLANSGDPRSVGETLARGLEAASKLAQGGIVVLDSQAVIAAPPELQLDLLTGRSRAASAPAADRPSLQVR
jgi:hypothetical protein